MPNDSNETLGALLRHWRIESGLSQNTLALQAGVASSTVSRWETDSTQPNLPELEAVLKVMQVRGEHDREALRRLKAPRASRRLRQIADAVFLKTPRAASPQMLSAPSGGHLLRAMRLRRGMTQAHLASLLGGIPQNFVARWERGQGEAWPDTARLQEICFHLGARAEELSALTVGRFSLASLMDERDPDALHQEQWRLRVEPEYSPGAPLKDLRFLSLEARLHNLMTEPGQSTGKQEQFHRILGWTYSRHAQYLQEVGRVNEAAGPARQAISLQTPGHIPDDEGWVPALLALAADNVRKSGAHRYSLNLLEHRLPDVSRVAYRAWLLSDMAHYALRAGLKAEAVDLSGRALHLVNTDDGDTMTVERRLRMRDHASFLLAAGRAAEAAAHLPQGPGEQWSTAIDQTVRDLLLRAEVFATLRQPGEAETALRRSYELIDSLDKLKDRHRHSGLAGVVSPLRSQADALIRIVF